MPVTGDDDRRRFARNGVAAWPRASRVQRYTSPDGRPFHVVANPSPSALEALVKGHSMEKARMWMSPDGATAYAWQTDMATHFQLFGDLQDAGWHQIRIAPRGAQDGGALVSADETAAEVVLASPAVARATGGDYVLHTSQRTSTVRGGVEHKEWVLS